MFKSLCSNKQLGGVITLFIVGAFCIFVADRMFGIIQEKMYYSSKYGIYGKQIHSLTASDEEMLILGSSRAAHHYIPQILSDSLGMSCFNAGSDGMCVYYHYVLLASRIERGRVPKVVLWEVMDLDAEVSQGATFTLDAALDRLAPHYGEHAAIDSLIALKGWQEKLKMLSLCYRYNSKLVQTIKCNFMPSPENHGYEALEGTLPASTEFRHGSFHEKELEQGKLEYVRKMIDLAKSNDIKLVMVMSPQFAASNSTGIKAIKAMAAKNDVCFLDHINDEQFMHTELFKDVMHLNDSGARRWTSFVAHELKEHITQ